jgi:formate hydrogenlyase subunit 3/multisubunit Na+/H+ antiporter MnhD subunit
LGVFTGLFLTGMLLVVLADDAFLFMVAWELMSLSSYFLPLLKSEWVD